MKTLSSLGLTLLMLVSFLNLSAQQVDTIIIHSPKMNIDIKNVVILPEGYSSTNKNGYPVVYLLHGYSGNYATWVKTVKKNLPELASKYQTIIVCPDGKNSWYWDSPINPKSAYDTYVSRELISEIDSRYKTIAEKRGRAISGFSMGGHGALWLTIQHPDVFGAVGSMSGGVDIRPFPKSWEMYKVLGKYSENKKIWDEYTVTTHIDKLKGLGIPLIIDCGEEDFFLEVNETLHKKLLDLKIPHVYKTSSGKHTPAYWRRSIDDHLQFFSDFFNQK